MLRTANGFVACVVVVPVVLGQVSSQPSLLTKKELAQFHALMTAYEEQRSELLAVYESELRNWKCQKLPKSKSARKHRATRMRWLRTQIEALKKRSKPVYPDLRNVEGAVGRLPLMESTWQVFQVVSDHSALMRCRVGGRLALFKVPTDGMVTDENYDLSGLTFECVGTQTYTTVIGGSNTVRVYQLVSQRVCDAFEARFPMNKRSKRKR